MRTERIWNVVLLAGLATLGCGADGPAGPPGPPNAEIATYRVTFNATWSAATHPTGFPPNPHFSGLIGSTHDGTFTMWSEGGVATAGIKDMAELGAKTALTAEVNAAIQAGSAWGVLSGDGVNPSPESVSLTFQIHEDYPFVSLVSMIAPSPDWFVGVAGLSLRQNDAWVDETTIALLPYDAGTDDGATYTSANAVTAPPAAIQRITGVPFDASLPLGTFRFERQ